MQQKVRTIFTILINNKKRYVSRISEHFPFSQPIMNRYFLQIYKLHFNSLNAFKKAKVTYSTLQLCSKKFCYKLFNKKEKHLSLSFKPAPGLGALIGSLLLVAIQTAANQREPAVYFVLVHSFRVGLIISP